MIHRNRQGIVGWDLLLVLSLLGVLAGLWFVVVRPKPDTALRSRPGSTLKEIESTTRGMTESAIDAEDAIQARTWDLSAETLGSEIMSRLTRLAESHHLKVNGYHAGRVVPASALQEVPFTVVVEGAFLDVMSAVDELEQPESKVALSFLKVSSKNDPGDVTATFGFTGFLSREAK